MKRKPSAQSNDKAKTAPENKKKNKPPKENERIKLDQILKLLMSVSRKMLIETLNGLFSENFNPDDVAVKINKTSTEFVPESLDIIRADSFFSLEDKTKPHHFHIEYEISGNDMTIRVFEYAVQKALESQRLAEKTSKKILYLPRSLVIHFEESKKIPDKYELEIVFPDGASHNYSVDVLKYWTQTDEALKSKKLYNLLPLQVFLLRAELKKVRTDAQRLAAELRAKKIADKIFTIINELLEEEKIIPDDYNKITTGLREIVKYLDNTYNLKIQGGLRAMKTIADKKILKKANEAVEALNAERERNREKNKKIIQKLLLSNTPEEEIADYGFTGQEIQEVRKNLGSD